MACTLWHKEIDAYVDGGLAQERARKFEAHLEGCASCSADVLARMKWKRATKLAGRRYAPTAEFRRRVVESLTPKPERRPNWNWLAGWAVSAVAIVLLLVFSYRGRVPGGNSALSEVTDLHVSALASAAPLDVTSSDKHTVKPWFAGRLPFTFQLPALEGTGFTLLGGRVVYLEHSPAAQLIFQVRKHRISLFILQDRPPASRGLQAAQAIVEQEQFTIDTWSDAGLRYFLITDASRDDIRQLSGLLRAAAQANGS
ncbi:MAG TPA: anti-sigma factor [Candidatus Acidoferrales bacterium]|nr:anti-sigma factor [Candidatus Acidoferrales bacterium]